MGRKSNYSESYKQEAVAKAEASGNVHNMLANYISAQQVLEQALTIYRQLKQQRAIGAILGNLGNTYYFQHQYTPAIAYFQQALSIAQQLGDRLNEAN